MPAFVCPSITRRTFSQTSTSSPTLLVKAIRTRSRIRKKSADLLYSDQELLETGGVQNLKAYEGAFYPH
eukprot:scaffold14040_cov74-Cyclotella_meneghiniana.AAC.2